MKSYKNIQELNKEWEQFGYHLTEKGEIIGTYQNKKYKVGEWKADKKVKERFSINATFYQGKDIKPIC